MGVEYAVFYYVFRGIFPLINTRDRSSLQSLLEWKDAA